MQRTPPPRPAPPPARRRPLTAPATPRSQPQQLSTYALTLFPYEADVEGRKVSVDFWDTAGQERFNSLHPSCARPAPARAPAPAARPHPLCARLRYYYQAHACILCFDVTRKLTYKNLSTWYKELQEHRKSIPCIVVANKIDLDRKSTTKSFNFATKRNLDFYYVSAADGCDTPPCLGRPPALGPDKRRCRSAGQMS